MLFFNGVVNEETLIHTWKSSPVLYELLFSLSSGLWERQDGAQQQLQPLWQVHPGQLSGEWHCQGVRHTLAETHTHTHTQKKLV